MDPYASFYGYYPLAPSVAVAPGAGAEPVVTAQAPAAALSGIPASFSGSFAVSGWLAAAIVLLAGYRLLWETS